MGRPPGQDRGAKTRPQGQLECANPPGSPGGWSGLELTDALPMICTNNPFLVASIFRTRH